MDLPFSPVEMTHLMANFGDSKKHDVVDNTMRLRIEVDDDSVSKNKFNKVPTISMISGKFVYNASRQIIDVKITNIPAVPNTICYPVSLEFKRKGNIKSAASLPDQIQTKNKIINNISRQKYKCFLGEFETEIYWGNSVAIAMLHIGTIYGIFADNVFFQNPWTLIYGLIVGGLGGFGITGGAHRFWTHKCYKAKLPLKIILLICYSIAGQNTIFDWVRDHRVHHKFSETDADPHNSKRGFLFSHCGWLCMKKHSEVLRKGKSVDVSDISSDRLLRFHTRHWIWFKLVFCFILPSIIPPYLYGEPWQTAIVVNCIVRYCLLLNFTWSVNSFAHIFGNRPYNRTIQPVENKFVSIVSMGEGWHNYHHSFPWDYRAAEMGTFFNITTVWLNIFAKIGWAYDLKTTSPKLVKNLIRNNGDGTHESFKM